MIGIKVAALKQSSAFDYLIRFALGGLATVVAGLIADGVGPVTGGLFLAFPAIFCAGATLIDRHERQRKERHGLRGERRGKQAAALDAVGAAWASIAMMAFAFVCMRLSNLGPLRSLGLAGAMWLICAVSVWLLRRKLRLVRVLKPT